MRILLIGPDEKTEALATILKHEKGLDEQRYVVTVWKPDEIAGQVEHHEAAIIPSDDGFVGDVPVLDLLLRRVPLVILLSCIPSIPCCVEALRRGAWDYLEAAPAGGNEIDALLASLRKGAEILGIGRAHADLQWIRERFAELTAAHPGQWIAVRNQAFVDSDVVFSRLRSRGNTEGAVFWRIPEPS